eukprot:CAMPEP_0182854648 /NCGR_PEP_ID=MMETSP0034_2-20130328/1380_1 /TAXON_ID=156128 /ORGANISM="Nephroselmis pyriformis, Strain CCMP717" /LENGTH=100 /DNA_ID=CAMNT_0024985509 /DNA_START=84 /DNA_END=385 /DNA_ORIENTATION=-
MLRVGSPFPGFLRSTPTACSPPSTSEASGGASPPWAEGLRSCAPLPRKPWELHAVPLARGGGSGGDSAADSAPGRPGSPRGAGGGGGDDGGVPAWRLGDE